MITDEKLQELYLTANLGQRLLIKRKELKLSRTDFARKLNVSSNTLSKYEKSETIPNPNHIREIFEILDINIADFLTERHQHILDVRLLLKEELKLISQRIDELEKMIRYYEHTKHKVQELIDDDCSFATEYDDIEVSYEFSGNGKWLSEKVYLTKGTYVFNFEADVKQPTYTVLELFDIVNNKEVNVFYEEIKQRRIPFIVEKNGYYLLHLNRAPDKWKMSLQKEIINI